MPAFPRAELDDMVGYWLAENEKCEQNGDWRPLAELYTADATYGWNIGPQQDFMAVGRDEIRDLAFGQEMEGLEGWTYPYQRVLVDDRQGEVIGLWKQIADARRPDGTPYEVVGIGGSWFRYAGDRRWDWQRDFFDFGNVSALYLDMIKADALSAGMRARIQKATSGKPLPGFYQQGQAPVPIW
ncbi:nuclear transport factor 2 family protein [Amycolatopsis acidicola]|uniref:Nuclear transport factor 2 family protein n=1 Tax=Amycolatopsis acidicola TaxID=2596893 RepID=A0A5N0UWF6_9PSEU|nr:nuclear transport factor 2 family protein [Amycolatopsis acidicola]KAA9156531.1 nuclear transport factor 2 family protein [Amycolatopsis acidicola]